MRLTVKRRAGLTFCFAKSSPDRLLIIVAAMLLAAVTACHSNAPLAPLPPSEVPMPPVSEVESVVFLVGDMGEALWDRSPMPRRLAAEVESWSTRLRTDSSVAVLFLGDNVYPRGLR